MSNYKKPHLTFQEQLNLLKSRGLEISNDKAALEYLQKIGYYRLSGYLYPFRQTVDSVQPHISNKSSGRQNFFVQDTFKPGAKFQDALALYVFDKRLRLMLLDALERIEVAIRVDIAYLLGSKDPFAYDNPNLLHNHFTQKESSNGLTKHQIWQNKHNQLIERSKETFVQHFKEKYGFPLPIWVVVELWDFGLLSTFYQGMEVKDKTKISKKYSIQNWQLMESWLRCLNHTRNIAAHHSRLWNKNLSDRPKLPSRGEVPFFDGLIGDTHATSRVYIALCITTYLMSYVCPNSSWPSRLKELIKSFPQIEMVGIGDMGFPEYWESHAFWK